jgi:DNA-binding response OmpR family regulator
MKKKLTVIDDDSDLRNLLQIALKNEGFDVVSYANGREFLESIPENDPAEVYVIDINLGGITGYEICERLKALNSTKSKAVILISANPDVQELAQASCADDYMLKPISLKILIQKVKELIRD